MAIAQGGISNIELQTDNKARVVITGASRGYPGGYKDVRGKQYMALRKPEKLMA